LPFSKTVSFSDYVAGVAARPCADRTHWRSTRRSGKRAKSIPTSPKPAHGLAIAFDKSNDRGFALLVGIARFAPRQHQAGRHALHVPLHGPTMVSSKSLMSKMSAHRALRRPPKFRTCASPQICVRQTGARQRRQVGRHQRTAPRKNPNGDTAIAPYLSGSSLDNALAIGFTQKNRPRRRRAAWHPNRRGDSLDLVAQRASQLATLFAGLARGCLAG